MRVLDCVQSPFKAKITGSTPVRATNPRKRIYFSPLPNNPEPIPGAPAIRRYLREMCSIKLFGSPLPGGILVLCDSREIQRWSVPGRRENDEGNALAADCILRRSVVCCKPAGNEKYAECDSPGGLRRLKAVASAHDGTSVASVTLFTLEFHW